MFHLPYGPGHAKTCLMPFANNKGTSAQSDQHFCCSLLTASAFRKLLSINVHVFSYVPFGFEGRM